MSDENSENQEYNPDELEAVAADALAKDITGETSLSNIRRTTVGEAYQSDMPHLDNYDNPNQPCLEISAEYEIEGQVVEITDILPIPENDISWQNPQTKLGQFYRQYGQMPREGMKVSVVMQESGFLGFQY